MDDEAGVPRRELLRRMAGAAITGTAITGTVAAAAPPAGAAEEAAAAPAPAAPPGYQSLGPQEAALVEALVDVMCPADQLSPAGTACGLAVFIDRQLAGGFGHGERLYMRGPWRHGKPQLGYQLPLTPEQFFKVGLAALNDACRKTHGRNFDALPAADADAFLSAVAAGKVTDPRVPLATWFDDLVYPLFVQACFADPVYGGNRDKVFWRMVGYPGLPATHRRDMVAFRGKPYPGARDPKSIADFS